MAIKKSIGIEDKNGDINVFIPPAPEGDDLGGISASDVSQISQNATDIARIDNSLTETIDDVHELKNQNLLKPTLSETLTYGITSTLRNDGTIVINGTATANAIITISYIDFTKMSGRYKLVGCPNGGSSSTYKLNVWGDQVLINDSGDGVVFDSVNKSCEIRITIYQGTTCNNLLFKPMLTKNLDATYADFKPFNDSFASGQEITNLNNALNELTYHNTYHQDLGNNNSINIWRKGQTIEIYISAGAISTGNNVIIYVLPENIRPKINYALGVFYDRNPPYVPIGSVWLGANGNVSIYKPSNITSGYAHIVYVINE